MKNTIVNVIRAHYDKDGFLNGFIKGALGMGAFISVRRCSPAASGYKNVPAANKLRRGFLFRNGTNAKHIAMLHNSASKYSGKRILFLRN